MANTTVPTPGVIKYKKQLVSELNWKYARSVQFPQGTAGQQSTAQLLNGFIVSKLQLNLNFTVTPTAATAAFTDANIVGADGWSLIQNLQIVINGGQNIRYLSGEQLYFWNILTGRNVKQGWTFATVAPFTATFNGTIDIPFALPDIFRPLDTCLDARLLGQNAFTANITYNSATSVLTLPTGATGLVLSPINASIFQVEFASGSGGFSPQIACLTEQYQNIYAGAVTNSGQQLVGQTANKLYYAFLVNVKTAGGVDDTTGTLLQNFQLYSGSNYIINANPQRLREDWDSDHPGYFPWRYNGNSPLQGTGASSDNINAWYYIPTVSDGYLHGALDVTNVASLFYAATTSAASTVNVMALTLRA